MVHPPVDDQKRLSAGNLAVEHPCDVDTALPNDVAAEFDNRACLGHPLCNWPVHQVMEVLCYRLQVEWSVLLDVRDAEAATQIDVAHRCGQVLCESADEIDGVALRLGEGHRVQVLRAGEYVEAENVRSRRCVFAQHCRHLFRVDAELLWSAAHPHSRSLHSEVGIHPHGDVRRKPEFVPRNDYTAEFRGGFDFDGDTGCDCLPDFCKRLAGAGEADLIGGDCGVENCSQFQS